ncbi:MAG: DUF1080 domain-containing protein [Armatimonadota bacterium]|nr:DUF1080 domain-containing protein [Armatimonadota bacterium]
METSTTHRRQLVTLAALGALAGTLIGPLPQGQAAPPIKGMIGVGTWATQAEFKDIKVIKGGRTIFSSNFSQGMRGWKTMRGKWQVVNGALRQTSNQEDARAVAGNPSWTDYTLTLKARKLGGKEGFLVIFGSQASPRKTWWNLGGWVNKQHAVEYPGAPWKPVPGKIATGRWYNIRVDVKGPNVKCYLDGKRIHDVTRK